jgi:hypothetical protein
MAQTNDGTYLFKDTESRAETSAGQTLDLCAYIWILSSIRNVFSEYCGPTKQAAQYM